MFFFEQTAPSINIFVKKWCTDSKALKLLDRTLSLICMMQLARRFKICAHWMPPFQKSQTSICNLEKQGSGVLLKEMVSAFWRDSNLHNLLATWHPIKAIKSTYMYNQLQKTWTPLCNLRNAINSHHVLNIAATAINAFLFAVYVCM
jgi:uncharacterized membrane protein